jgi:hypothetical protein
MALKEQIIHCAVVEIVVVVIVVHREFCTMCLYTAQQQQ